MLSFFPTTDGSSCWFSGIVLPEGSSLNNAKDLCSKLKDNGIESRSFWKPIHLQKPYASTPTEDVSTSESLWQRIITLPCSTGISDADFEKVVSVIKGLDL